MSLGFSELLALYQIMTPDGMAQLRVVIESAPEEGRAAARRAVYARYPWAKEFLEVALARDREGAFAYVCQVGEDHFGSIGRQTAGQFREYVYQIYDWLQDELDKPRPELSARPRVIGK